MKVYCVFKFDNLVNIYAAKADADEWVRKAEQHRVQRSQEIYGLQWAKKYERIYSVVEVQVR